MQALTPECYYLLHSRAAALNEVSEDIEVAQLAAPRQGSKEAKVPGPASIWNSRPSWP